jgi:hypothetical protein
MVELDDFTNFAAGIDVIDSGYKMFSDALASAVNNEQRFELKGMIEGYINMKENLSDGIKKHLIETLHKLLPDEIKGGKKQKKSIKTKKLHKSKKSRKTRKNH